MANPSEILIVGNGKMAREYARLFRESLALSFSVAGRKLENSRAFQESEGARSSFVFDEMDSEVLRKFDSVIVAASEESLEQITIRLLEVGVRRILLEKPGALSVSGSRKLAELADAQKAFVRIACNRRYYPSIRKLKSILREEHPTAAIFEFTEMSAQIGRLPKTASVKARWGLINPIHVVDTLSFLLGPLSNLNAHHFGSNEIDWHPTSSIFQGTAQAGRTPVVYASNWLSPGRWDIQIMTRNGRYKLSPMERLVVMRHDSRFQWIDVKLEVGPGDAFKPGLYEMVSDFQASDSCELPDLHENTRTLDHLSHIFGYSQ